MSRVSESAVVEAIRRECGYGAMEHEDPMTAMLGQECAQPHLRAPTSEARTPAEVHAYELEDQARTPEIVAACIFFLTVVGAATGRLETFVTWLRGWLA